jgi:hypothetical protein
MTLDDENNARFHVGGAVVAHQRITTGHGCA